jgi:hypothetical protein
LWSRRSSGVPLTQAPPAPVDAGQAALRPPESKSRRLPGEMRALLFQHGVTEGSVVKSLTEERTGAAGPYLEGTLVVKAGDYFQPALFLMDLGRLLEAEKLSLAKNVQEKEKWLLDIGEADRIYQHLEVQFGGAKAKAAPAQRVKKTK